MQSQLSFSTGKITETFTLTDWVRELAKLSTDAIELGFVRAERIPAEFTEDLLSELRQFKKVYIHAPVKLSDDWIKYPSNSMDKCLEKLKDFIDLSKNTTNILFHPDLVEDFNYLTDVFGKKLTFENMDAKKSYGVSIRDLDEVFTKAPQAQWVCDINHIYTVDKSMEFANELHEHFENRLAYYHVSALGSFHELFIDNPNEMAILKGIKIRENPLIHEGFDSDINISSLKKEKKLIEAWLTSN